MTTRPKQQPAIFFRCPRKREFFAALALAGEKANSVLCKMIDEYIAKQQEK